MTTVVPLESIVSKIIFLRSEKVLLDLDLAELYGVETKQLKRAVRRNIDRFPPDFMFELTKEEYDSLRYQFGTLVGDFINTLTYYYLKSPLIYGMVVIMEVTHATKKPVSHNSERR